jgi:hypothetical protein
MGRRASRLGFVSWLLKPYELGDLASMSGSKSGLMMRL